METLSRREFIQLSSAMIPAATMANKVLAADGTSQEMPNIIFVFADQMRAHALGCMGNDQVITPNLDKLADEGLLVTNALSVQPVCTPYRAQLLTGRYGHSTGVIHNDIRLPDSEVVVSELMKKHDYATGYIGKWHLSGNRRDPVDAKSRRGWDFWAVRNCSHAHSKPVYWLNDSKEPVKVPGWEPEVQTDLAIEYIKKNKRNPFCLFMSYGPPHNPYKAPKKYLDMYKGKTLKNRPNVPGDDTRILKEYYAMVTSLDECMKRVTDSLEAEGIADNTILIFSSDHGDMLNSHGHRLKQRPWEEAINIPFIVRYPKKIKPGQRRDYIVSSVDVMPTLLGFAGIPVPSNVEGMNYADTFMGKSTKEREAAFLFNVNAGNGPGTDWRGIRTKEWSYAYHAKGDWIMHNVKKDPYQMDNLINNPEYAGKKKELFQQIEAMRNELGESLPLKGGLPSKGGKSKERKKK